MNITYLSEEELNNHYVGEALSVTAIMTVMCAAIMAIVIYKLFFSKKGSATIPGGWKFTWN